jgi:hypothetical protein
MIPARLAPLAFGFVLPGLMSLLVSGIATFRHAGPADDFAGLWLSAWLTSWPVAVPVVLVIAPIARRVVQRLVVA